MGFDVAGMLAAVFTPMDDAGNINYDVIPEYMQYLKKSNVEGLLVLGTTGESGLMTVAERKLVLEAWMKAAKPLNVKVIVHIGGAPLPNILELAKHAEEQKVDGLLTLPDLYYKPKTIEPIVTYLELISKAAPSLPILYYHSPKLTGVDVNIRDFSILATSRIPNFKGIKGDWSHAAQLTDTLRSDQKVFICNHNILQAAMLGHLTSAPTVTNIFPSHVHRLLEATKNNDLEAAGRAQIELNRLVDAISSFYGPYMYGEFVAATKVAMEIVTGVKVGPPRQPLIPLNKEQISQLKEKLQSLGY